MLLTISFYVIYTPKHVPPRPAIGTTAIFYLLLSQVYRVFKKSTISNRYNFFYMKLFFGYFIFYLYVNVVLIYLSTVCNTKR